MANDNDEITLQRVQTAAEQVARSLNKPVQEVTNREVKENLKRKNDGYIGAHLQTIKIEHVRAKLLEEKDVSPHYSAAFYDEIKRHADNAREVALAEAEVTKQMFCEICESNNALEESLADKNKEIIELQRDHAEVVQNLSNDLNTSQTEKSALEVRLKDALDRLDKTGQELNDVRADHAVASVELSHVTKERDELQDTSKTQKDRIQEVEKELTQSCDEVRKAEQRAELLNWKNDEILRERDEARQKLDVMTERAATAEAQLKAGGLNKTSKVAVK